MASNKVINKQVRGVRDQIPAGYAVGRLSGKGAAQLIPVTPYATKGYVAGTTVGIGTAAGGDLGGTYPNPTVVAIQGYSIKSIAPTNGQVLTWVAADSKWEPVSPAGGAIPSSFWLDGTHGYVAEVDSHGILVLDSSGYGVYDKDPVLPAAMIPAVSRLSTLAVATIRF